MFRHPFSVIVGEVVERDGFVFADIRLEVATKDTRARRTLFENEWL